MILRFKLSKEQKRYLDYRCEDSSIYRLMKQDYIKNKYVGSSEYRLIIRDLKNDDKFKEIRSYEID